MLNILAQAAGPAPSVDWVTTLGVPAVVVLLLLQAVMKILDKIKDMKEKKNGNGNGATQQQMSDMFKLIGEIKSAVNDLHQWHDVKDEDHVFAWYVRKSLGDSICELKTALGKVNQSIEKQTEALKHLLDD